MTKIDRRDTSAVKSKMALEALKGIKTVAELCQEYEVTASHVAAGKEQLEKNLCTTL